MGGKPAWGVLQISPSYVNLTTSTGPLASIPEQYQPAKSAPQKPGLTAEEQRLVSFLQPIVAANAGVARARSGKLRAPFRADTCEAFILAADLRRSTDLMLKATSPNAFGTFIADIAQLMEGLRKVIVGNHGGLDKLLATGDSAP